MLLRAAIICLVIAAVETTHGILRARVLAPRIGDLKSRQVGVFTGSILILAVTHLTLPWINPERTSDALLIGLVWFLGMLSFELVVGHFVFRFPWKWLFNEFNFMKGRLLAFGMVILFFAPLLIGKLHGRW